MPKWEIEHRSTVCISSVEYVSLMGRSVEVDNLRTGHGAESKQDAGEFRSISLGAWKFWYFFLEYEERLAKSET